MGMFTRLFGGKAGAAERSAQRARAVNLVAPSPGEPSFAEAVPNRVVVAFHAHDNLEGFSGNFLTAVTRGFTSVGQRELVLSLRLGDSEQPIPKMQEILRFFATVQAWAEAGSIVDQGGLTQFGERALFSVRHGGLIYVEARAISGIDLPARALSAVFVQAPEIGAARDYGTYRVLTRIGAQLRLFPFPTWGALDRPSTITARESESLLSKVLRMHVPSASFLVADQCLRLTIPRDAKSLARGVSSLPTNSAFVLLTRPAASANAILTWKPGQREMTGISPDGSDGSRLSGCCAMFVPSSRADEARPFEDGYSVLLSEERWTEWLAALIEQRPLSFELAGEMRFELEWDSST